MSFLERLRTGLRRTTDNITNRLKALDAESGHPDITKKSIPSITALDTLEEVLLESDLGVAATSRLIHAVRERGEGEDLVEAVKAELLGLLEVASPSSVVDAHPRVVLIVGVNGTGKTTTVGRLAYLETQAGKRPMICAADTFRAAAVEQLEVWARRADAEFVQARAGSDPAAVVFDAISSGKAKRCDVVLVDTAGRLHTRTNLMGELDKIRRVAGRAIEGAPHETLLVLDATVGQNGLSQARKFLESSGVTGIVLTKLDGTAKGGIAAAITADLGVPIRYVGVGERSEDLLPFSATDYVEALFRPSW